MPNRVRVLYVVGPNVLTGKAVLTHMLKIVRAKWDSNIIERTWAPDGAFHKYPIWRQVLAIFKRFRLGGNLYIQRERRGCRRSHLLAIKKSYVRALGQARRIARGEEWIPGALRPTLIQGQYYRQEEASGDARAKRDKTPKVGIWR